MDTDTFRQKRYTDDKPEDCTYCYFWKKSTGRCSVDKCSYLVSDREQEEKTHISEMPDCAGCPYGKHSRCIGCCLLKIMQETALKNKECEK